MLRELGQGRCAVRGRGSNGGNSGIEDTTRVYRIEAEGLAVGRRWMWSGIAEMRVKDRNIEMRGQRKPCFGTAVVLVSAMQL